MKLTTTNAITTKLPRQSGRCLHCGMALSNPLSVARGIGPVCYKQIFDDPADDGPASSAAAERSCRLKGQALRRRAGGATGAD